MDKLLIELFHNLNFNDDEIANLLNICPVLEYTSADDAIKNISIVTSAGFPELDIDSIIAINPAFLVCEENLLIKNIEKVLITYDDFEAALKENPFLI